MRTLLIPLLVVTCASAAFADSIDELEAKQRGVPVGQVVAENSLAKEKAKTAALEKQVAELKKQLAQATGEAASAPTTAPAGAPSPTPSAINFDGPRESSPLYDGLVDRYLSGNWTTLAADLAAQQKQISALPAGNVADLTYIKQTIAECRPAWWDQVKTGKTKQFRQTIWNQPVSVNFQDGSAARYMGNTITNGTPVMNLTWPASHMDSTDPMSLIDVSLDIPGEFGFVQADGVDSAIWNLFGGVAALAQVGTERARTLSPGDKALLNLHSGFMQNAAAGYFGTPPARRLVFVGSLSSMESAMNDRIDWTTRRPLGAALMIDIALHPKAYKTLKLETILGLDKLGDAGAMEEFPAKILALQLLKTKLTLAEDRHLRDMIKSIVDSHADWKVTKLSLPNNLSYDLKADKDGPLAAERVAFISKSH